MQGTRRGASAGSAPSLPRRRLRPHPLQILAAASALAAAGLLAAAHVDDGPPWAWLGATGPHADAPPPSSLLLPEAEARRVTYVTAAFRVTNHQTITVTFSGPVYATQSSYTNLRLDTGDGLEPRSVCNLGGPYQTRGWHGITSYPSRTHTLTVCGDSTLPNHGRLPPSTTGLVNVASLRHFDPGNIFEGNSVTYYYQRASNVRIADGQAPSFHASGGSAPSLNLESSVLLLRFNERMDASRTNLHGITLSCAPSGGGTGAISLGNLSGAVLPAADSADLGITLSPGQKSALVSAYDGRCVQRASAWRVSLGSSSLFDAGGNALPPASDVSLRSLTRDTLPPALTGQSIDLSSGVAVLRFNEYVEASGGALGGIAIRSGGAGGQALRLEGASMEVSESSATITLTETQRIGAVRGHGAAGGLLVGLDSGTFRDLAGHPLANVVGAQLAVTPDTTPPALLAGVLPSLDLNTGNLSLAFGESIDVGATNATGIRLLGPGSSVLAELGGLDARPGSPSLRVDGRDYSATVEFALNRTLRADSVGAARIAAPPGAFADAAGNRSAALSALPLNVTADTTRPTNASTPRLDLNGGTLTIKFDEFIGKVRPWGIVLRDESRQHDTALGGAAVLPPPEGSKYTDTIVVNLTLRQAADAVVSGARLIEANPATFEDISGNPFTGLNRDVMNVVDDTTRPALDGARPPVINRAGATLALSFTEYIDVSANPAPEISIIEAPSDPPLTLQLSGLSLPAADGDVVVIGLSSSDVAALGARTSARINITEGSFEDMSGNGIDDVIRAVRIPPDAGAPRAVFNSTIPQLDLGALSLTIAFNETVAAPEIDLSGIAVEGSDGGNRTYMTGASPPDAAGRVAAIGITEDQKSSIIAANSTNGPVRINMSSSIVSDQSGNAFAGQAGALNLVPDADPPSINATMLPVLDLADGSLTVWFDEHVNATRVNPERVQLINATNSGTVHLTGATVRSLPPESPPQHSVTLLLTSEQKAYAVMRNSSQITSSAVGAFYDLSNNGIALRLGGAPINVGELPGYGVRVVEDAAAPRLLPVPGPVLDLGGGTLTFAFDEHVVYAGARPGLVEIAGAAAQPGSPPPPRIALASSNVLVPDALPGVPAPVSSNTVNIALSPHEKAAAVAAVAAGGSVAVGPGAFSDTSGNPNTAQSAVLGIVDDDDAPEIDAAVLDLGAGTLTLRFAEYVSAPATNLLRVLLAAEQLPGGGSVGGACASDVGLGGASALAVGNVHAAAPPGASAELRVSLTAAQKAAAAACSAAAAASGSGLEMVAEQNAFRDLSNVGNPEYTGLDVEALADADAPRPDPLSRPALDLDAGTLTVRFAEYVNASAADPSLVSLSAAGGVGGGACASGIGLAGASATPDMGAVATSPPAPPGTSPAAVINLTESQRAAAATCWTKPEVRGMEMDAQRGAFPDVSWNPSTAFSGVPVSVANDTTRPALVGASSSPPPILLNLAAGTISFTFNEHVEAASADPSLVTVTGAGGGSPTVLSGSPVRGPDGATLVLGLSTSRVSSISVANQTSGPVEVDIGPGAFTDLSGNKIAGANDQPVSFSSDTTPPALHGTTRPSLDLGGGMLTVRFDEPVAASIVNASGIAVAPASPGPARASAVPLGGAAVAAVPGDASSIVLALTPAQRAASLAVHAGGPSVLRVSPGSVADLAFNPAEAGTAPLTVVPDGTGPVLSADPPPRLDLNDGVLSVRFDEYVSASSANQSQMRLFPPDPAPAVDLASASVVDDYPDSDTLRVRLTPDLKAAAAGAQRVQLLPAAASDLSSNAAGGVSAALSVARDVTAPRLADTALPVLNLSSGVLSAAFDEHVDASSANLSRLAVVGAQGSPAVGLGGASLASGDGAGVAVRLTPAQRAAAFDADATAGPARLAATEAGALRDLSGNPLAAFAPFPLIVVPDSAGPAVVAAGDMGPSLDLGTGILTVSFDEPVDAAASNLSAVHLVTTNGDTIVRLSGYEAAARQGGASLVVELAPSDLDAVIAGAFAGSGLDRCDIAYTDNPATRVSSRVAAGVRLESAAGAFYDVLGNPSAQLTATGLRVDADLSNPLLDAGSPPLLNTANRSIVLTFNEGLYPLSGSLPGSSVRDASGTPIVNGLPEPVHLGDGRVRFDMTSVQVDDAVGATGGPQIFLRSNSLRNLSCLPLDGDLSAALAIISDNAPPVMLGEYPKLNLGNAVLEMKFDQNVDVAGVDASAVSLTGAGGLGGAAVSSPGGDSAASDTVLLSLTPLQKYNVVVANRTGPVSVSVTGTAVSDSSYLYYAGLADYQLGVPEFTPDTAPPRTLGGASDPTRRPTLDIVAGELTVHFDEYVKARSLGQNLVRLSAGASPAPGGSLALDMGLRVAPVAVPDSPPDGSDAGQSLSVSLRPADVRAAVVGGITHLNASDDAFLDASDAGYVSEGLLQMRVLRDLTPPRLVNTTAPVLDLGVGTLGLEFDKPVNASAASTSGIILWPSAPAAGQEGRSVSLARSSVTAVGGTGGLSTEVTVRLEPPDKAAAAAINASVMSLHTGAFADISHNLVGETSGVTLNVTDDGVDPRLDPDQAPELDLGAGTVKIYLTEHVNATTAMPLSANITGAGGSPVVRLSGALSSPYLQPLPDRAGQSSPLSPLQRDPGAVGAPAFEVVLTQRQRAAAAGLNDPDLAVPAGAFEDLFKNLNDQSTARLDVMRDVVGPAPDAGRLHDLNLGNGTLTVWLDEYVDVGKTKTAEIELAWGPGEQERVDLAAAVASAGPGGTDTSLQPLPAYASLSVSVALKPDQKAKAVDLERSGGTAQLVLKPGAFEDLSSNPSSAAEARLSVTADAVPPMLDVDKMPLLNLAARTLKISFDEYIDAGSVDAAAIEVVGTGAGAQRVPLVGAGTSSPNGTSIVLPLGVDHLNDIRVANDTSPPVRLDIGQGAFEDVSGVVFAGAAGVALEVTTDADPPALSPANRPTLDLNDGMLRVWFTEPIDADSIDPSGMNLTGAAGGGSVALRGASAELADPVSLAVGLTPAQKAAATAAYLSGGGGAQVLLGIGGGAVRDLAGNGIGELAGQTVSVTADTAAPEPTFGGHGLDLGNGTLEVRFDEHVNAAVTQPGLLELVGGSSGGGGTRIDLAGAEPVGAAVASLGSPSAAVVLAPAQKAAAVAAAVDAWSLEAEGSAFKDLSDNPSGEARVSLAVEPDDDPPLLADGKTPVLNLATGELTLVFDEYVDAGSVDAAAVNVTGAGAGAGSKTLDGADVRSPNGTTIKLAVNQTTSVAISRVQPALLDIKAGAFRDLAGNEFAGAIDVDLEVTMDADPPALSPDSRPALDLNDGMLRAWFTEPVDAGSIDLARMNLTVASAGNAPAGLLNLRGATAEASGDAVAVALTPAQKAGITSAYLSASAGAQVFLGIDAGAVRDLAYNEIAAVQASRADVTGDTTAPEPAGGSHRLDMGSGELEVRFDEHVNASATRTNLLELAGGGASVNLARAVVSPSPTDAGSQSAVVKLTPAQKAAAGDAAAERLEAESGSFVDLSGNPSGEANVTLSVAPDMVPPALAAGGQHLLNLAAGTLTLTFDEYVDAQSVDASLVAVRSDNGTTAAALEGARADGPDGADVTLVMSESHAAAVRAAHVSDPPVTADIAAGAFRDLSNNEFAGATGAELAVTSDDVRPALSGRPPSVDLNDGTLRVSFSEPVDAGRIATERIAIALAGPPPARLPQGLEAPSVSLAGAEPLDLRAAASDGSVAIGLTPAQKAFASVASSAGAELELRLGAGAVSDHSRNRNDNASAPLGVVPDSTPPAPSAERRPDLDLNGGTLRVEFDEHVDAGSVRPGLVSVGETDLQGSNASVSGTAVTIELTPAQKSAVVASVSAAAVAAPGAGANLLAASAPGDAAGASITIAAGAVADLSGNEATAHSGLGARTIPDTTPPVLLAPPPPVINASAATLVLAFDEYIDASAVNASGIVAEDSAGASGASLAGAAPRGPDGASIALGLSPGHIAGIEAAHAAAPPVRLDIEPGAFRDMSGNEFAGRNDVTARLVAQAAPPTPVPPTPVPPTPTPVPPTPVPPTPTPVPPTPTPVPMMPTAPPPPVLFSGSGGSGGSGGGGSGRTGVAPPANGLGDSAAAIHYVSWDCEAGTATALLGAAVAAAGPDVRIVTASGAERAERDAARDEQGLAAYTAPFAGDGLVSVRVVATEGRAAAVLSETVRTGGECAGRAMLAAPVEDAGGDAAADGGRTDAPDAGLGQGHAPPRADPAADATGPVAEMPDRDAPDDGQPRAADAAGSDGTPAPEPEPEPAPAPPAPPAADPGDPPAELGTEQEDGEPAPPPPPAPETAGGPEGGGCLVATAVYGTELAPQVQMLREVRDGSLASTAHGRWALDSFNAVYYAFSPHVADLERSSPAARAAAESLIAPPLWLLQLAAPGDGAADLAGADWALASLALALAAVAALAVPAARRATFRPDPPRTARSRPVCSRP